jgi:hypothetical protein
MKTNMSAATRCNAISHATLSSYSGQAQHGRPRADLVSSEPPCLHTGARASHPPCIHQGDTHCAHLLLTAATTGGWRRSILAAHKYWLRVRSWLRTSLAARSTGAKCWLLAISDARSLAQRMWAARSFGRPASLWACLPTDDEPLTSLLAPPWQTVAHPRVTVVPLSVLGQA